MSFVMLLNIVRYLYLMGLGLAHIVCMFFLYTKITIYKHDFVFIRHKEELIVYFLISHGIYS